MAKHRKSHKNSASKTEMSPPTILQDPPGPLMVSSGLEDYNVPASVYLQRVFTATTAWVPVSTSQSALPPAATSQYAMPPPITSQYAMPPSAPSQYAMMPPAMSQYTNPADTIPRAVALGAFIFAGTPPKINSSNATTTANNLNSPTEPRLLIVRRNGVARPVQPTGTIFHTSAPHPLSRSGKWEVPGGWIVDPREPILNAVVRVVEAQTGMSGTTVVGLVGPVEGERLVSRKGKPFVKLNFEVEVQEMNEAELVTAPPSPKGTGKGKAGGKRKRTEPVNDYPNEDVENVGVVEVEDIPVELDPGEHQRHAWVGEDELGELDWAYSTSQELVMQSFAGRASRMELHAFGWGSGSYEPAPQGSYEPLSQGGYEAVTQGSYEPVPHGSHQTVSQGSYG